MIRGMGLGILLSAVLAVGISAQSSFSQGEQYFLDNKPTEAASFLEAAVVEEPNNLAAFMYLGIAYQQLERYDDAIGLYLQILPTAGEESARVAYNLGNVYYAKGDNIQAERYYSQAIELNVAYESAYLNRANTKLRAGSTNEAIRDYQYYLVLAPGSPKRSQIERLMSFINAEAAAEVRRQAYAEAEARAAEERRIVEARAEAARLEQEAQAEADRLAAETRRLEEDARLERERVAAEERAAAIRREAETRAENARQAAEEARVAAEKRRQEQAAREAEEKRLAAQRAEEARQAAARAETERLAREAEARRLAEVRAEEARQAAAAKAEADRLAAEAERRRRLLEEVAASLQAASEESRGLSAGSDGVQHYDGEFELK